MTKKGKIRRKRKKRKISSVNMVEEKKNVMVHFVCQFGWPMVPRYLVKHYSRCLYEDVIG